MTQRRTPLLAPPLLAVLALFALIALACGSTVVQSTADRAAEPDAGSVPDETPTAVDPAATVAASPDAPLEHDSPQFGASLDEWTASSATDSSSGEQGTGNPDYATIAWPDLIPPGSSGAEIVELFRDRLQEVEPGSDEATALYEEMQAAFQPDAVNTDLDGQQIRLAGFVAPLTYDDDIVTEFLLVPNFGACIHVPPPPPNQTVMVSVDKENGLTVEEAWGPVWVEGTLAVEYSDTELAAASYSITSATSGVYDDF